MKKILIAGLVAFSGISMQAQDIDLSWGPTTKASSSDAAYQPLGWYDNVYYTIKYDNGNGYLLKFDDKLNLIAQPELMTGQKKFSAEMSYMNNGKLLLLDSEYEKDMKAAVIRAWTFTDDGRPSTIKEKVVAKFPVEKSKEVADLNFRYSPDQTKVLVFMTHDLGKKEESKVSMVVLNTSDLKVVWETSTTVPYLDEDFEMLSMAVDNSGNVIGLGVVRGGEGKRLAQYSTRIFTFSTANEKYDDRELKIDGKYISSAFIQYTGASTIMISGFYNGLTSKGKNEGIEGAFIAKTEIGNLQNLDLKVSQMSESTKASIAPQSSFAKFIGADELNAYAMRNINLRADGSGYVIAEQRFITRDLDSQGDRRTYYFNHIIIYNFDENQNITWISAVPKLQMTSITAPVINLGVVVISTWSSAMTRLAYKYNSYQQVEINGKIYLLYNDHKENGDAVTLKETHVMSNKKNANAVLVAVDGNNGKWEKSTVFSGKEVDVILESSSCFPMENVGFTISAEKGKDLQLGTITLK